MNLLGGRGKCSYCTEWHNNVSYHEANDCLSNPDSWACKEKYDTKPKPVVSNGLNIKCDSCSEQIIKPAALLFSPPKQFMSEKGLVYEQGFYVKKIHLCHKCYEMIADIIGVVSEVVDTNDK